MNKWYIFKIFTSTMNMNTFNLSIAHEWMIKNKYSSVSSEYNDSFFNSMTFE